MPKLAPYLRRIPLWGWVSASLCAFTLGVFLGWVLLKSHFKPVILWTGERIGQKFDIDSAIWKDGRFLELEGLDFGNLARIDKIDIAVSPLGLLKGQIDEIRIHGGRVWLGKWIASNQEKSGGGGLPFGITIKKLIVSNTTLYLDNLCAGLSPIPLTLAEVPPAIVFNDLHFGGSSKNAAALAKQSATIEHFAIYSPYDPSAKVLSFRKIYIEFSWAGLQSRQIDKLVFDTPIIHVGPDLFWFADDIKRKQSSSTSQPVDPWKIGTFELKNGKIVISANGQPSLPLPGIIEIAPTPLTLGDFSQLHLETKFISHIPVKEYPEYNLRFKNLEGDLAFNLPLGKKNDRANLVRQFTVEELEWKGLKFGKKGSPAWVVLTFDEKGIYCRLGAPVSGGYINGTVDIFLDNDMRWIASASSTGVDLAPITRLLSPDDFLMTGRVNAVFKVNGQSREILGLGGYARLPDKGSLEIVALEEMKKKLPAEWPQLKRDLSMISMEAFQHYDYNFGDLEFAYAPPNSFARLNLDGKQGKRNFEIHWKDERSKPKSFIIPENGSVIKMTTHSSTPESKK